MINDLPPWKEDPHNPTRKSGEKRKDKYGNEIKNVAKHLARKAMNSVKEAVFVSSRKKDLTAVKSEDTLVFDDHINCGTPDCCQTCDTADTTEIDEASAFADARRDLRRDSKGLAPTKRDEDDSESNEDPDEDKTPHLVSQLYKAVSINKPVKFKDGKSHTIAPHHAKKFINQYRSLKPADKEELQSKAHASHAEFKKAISEDIVRTGTLAQRTQAYRADKAKKAGAKLKMDPDTGTPDHFTAAMRRRKGLPEEVGKSNEWGTDALRRKYAAATPGQEGLAAKKIPTFDARYDDVPTRYIGGIKEALDNNHPIVKEYNALKKHDIKTLRGMISQSGGVVDTSGFKSKDHAASHIIRSKHGNKKVDAAFGFNEDTSADREVGTKSLVKKYQKETPGQEKADINEIFNTTFHEDIERRSDFRMVKVRTPTGFVWRKVRKEADIERDAE